MQPLVTVNILSYNRKDDLRNTLQKVFEQDYNNIEVIVVDNNSQDGSVEMVKSEFPSVHLLKLQNNIGIAGWNEGAKIAKGEYLLFLDDDSYPDKNALGISVQTMNLLPHCAILALHIQNDILNKDETNKDKISIYPNFIGCGVLFRHGMFLSAGMFNEDLFLYVHEIDFTLCVLQKGYDIEYEPNAIVHHSYSSSNRLYKTNNSVDLRKKNYCNRNIIIILLAHYSFENVIGRLFRIIAGRVVFGIYKGCVLTILRGFIAGMWITIKKWKSRKVMSQEIQKRYGYGSHFGGFFQDGEFSFRRPHWL
jgi:GT2 family glycosyltransferase